MSVKWRITCICGKASEVPLLSFQSTAYSTDNRLRQILGLHTQVSLTEVIENISRIRCERGINNIELQVKLKNENLLNSLGIKFNFKLL